MYWIGRSFGYEIPDAQTPDRRDAEVIGCSQLAHADPHRKHEYGRVPHITQQPEPGGEAPQPDRDHPGGDHHHRDRRDIDAEQVDLGEPHPGAPASK
jgi:hypothetical protein